MPLLNHHHFPLVNCVCHACAESVRFLGAGMAKGLDEVKVYVLPISVESILEADFIEDAEIRNWAAFCACA